MSKVKSGSIQVSIRWKAETYKLIRNDADANGVSIGAYLAMLANQKRLESQAVRFMANVPPDRLREVLGEEDGQAGQLGGKPA